MTARVACIIVNYNCGDWIARSLASIAAQTVAPSRVIVMDNASVDGSALRAQQSHPQFEFHFLKTNTGFAVANNRAVAIADDCEWIALVNPDACLAPDWLEKLLDASARHPDAASFASCLLMADAPERLDGAGDVMHVSGLVWRAGHGRMASDSDGEKPVFSACAAAALYRRESFLAAGGFDESFFCYVEDVDLGFRLRLAGESCWYIPSAHALHAGSVTSGGRRSGFSVFHGHRNRLWCVLKNMPASLLPAVLPAFLLADFLMFLRLCGDGHGLEFLRARLASLRAVPRVLHQRLQVQRQCRVRPSEVWSWLDKRVIPSR
ncbi:glycosyltransferase family 2 protein [Viridibacterium curvum]|uniref:Glycosyltransferase 2-like domain-containing protein n=1 Tax=Viridibacterium curvum TaxID=1101404 RepID=A0ABP9QL16_9RHOO